MWSNFWKSFWMCFGFYVTNKTQKHHHAIFGPIKPIVPRFLPVGIRFKTISGMLAPYANCPEILLITCHRVSIFGKRWGHFPLPSSDHVERLERTPTMPRPKQRIQSSANPGTRLCQNPSKIHRKSSQNLHSLYNLNARSYGMSSTRGFGRTVYNTTRQALAKKLPRLTFCMRGETPDSQNVYTPLSVTRVCYNISKPRVQPSKA